MMQTRVPPLLVMILLMAATPFADASRRESLVFITSRGQATTNLSTAEVRNIYLGRTTRWQDGHRITVIVRPATTAAGRTFLQQVVRMSEIDFSQNWLGVVFRGEASSPPRVIAPSDSVRKLVAGNADAIAFVLSSELAAEDDTLLRTLAIDGRTRDEDAYPYGLPP